MKKAGIAALILTLAVLIPVLFLITRSTVKVTQFIVIVFVVLLLVLWTILYVTLVDPWLRRGIGALFNVTIEWRGASNSIAWTTIQEQGCLATLFFEMLGYFFIILWLVPPGVAIALALWLHH